ncbi:MAG: carboxypeptidase regulatory-like domain-containing protein [bacterium]|nr:carboxypeptidase regulatory-like domain-containing protein [bacterium]
MSHSIWLVWILFFFGQEPAAAWSQAESESHAVQVLVKSDQADLEARIVCVRAPAKGQAAVDCMRELEAAEHLRFPINVGEQSSVHLPRGEWWVWAEGEHCKPSRKLVVRMPRSKPEFVLKFLLERHVGVSGRVVCRGSYDGTNPVFDFSSASVTLRRWDKVLRVDVGYGSSFFLFPRVEPGTYSVSASSRGYQFVSSPKLVVPEGSGVSGLLLEMEWNPDTVDGGAMAAMAERQKAGDVAVEGVLHVSAEPMERGEVADLYNLSSGFEGMSLRFDCFRAEPAQSRYLSRHKFWRDRTTVDWDEAGSFSAELPRPGRYLVRRLRKMTGGGSPGFRVDHYYKWNYGVGSPWVVEIPADPVNPVSWITPTGEIHATLLDGEGQVLHPSQSWERTGHLRILGKEDWSEPVSPTPTWNGKLVFEGLPPGSYTLSGVQEVMGAIGAETALYAPPVPTVIEVGEGRVDLNVTVIPATILKGKVVNPSGSLNGLEHPRLGVYAWEDSQRTKLLGSTALKWNSADFVFHGGLPKKAVYLSVESYPHEGGFRGPVGLVDLGDGTPGGFELLVP